MANNVRKFARIQPVRAGAMAAQSPTATNRKTAAQLVELERVKLEGDPLTLSGNQPESINQGSDPAPPEFPTPGGDRLILRLIATATQRVKAALGIGSDNSLWLQSFQNHIKFYTGSTSSVAAAVWYVSTLEGTYFLVGTDVGGVSPPTSRLHVRGPITLDASGIATSTTMSGEFGTYHADATAGAITLTLPPANDVEGRIYAIIRTNAGANSVVVDGDGAETLDGAASKSLDSQYAAITIQARNGAWYLLTSKGTVT